MFTICCFSQNIYDGLNHIVPITFHYELLRYKITKDDLLKKLSTENVKLDSNVVYLNRQKESSRYRFYEDCKLKSWEKFDSAGNMAFEITIVYDNMGNIVKITQIEGKTIKTKSLNSFIEDAPGVDQESVVNSIQERTSYCIYLYNEKNQITGEELYNGYDKRLSGSYLEYNPEGEIITETMINYPDGSRGTYSYTYYPEKIVIDYTEKGILIDRGVYDLKIKKWFRVY